MSQADWPTLQAQFARYRNGDASAARTVFEALERALRPFFRARIQSPEAAEDLTQATLLKIHFARERFDPGLSLKTWVFTIAGRCLIDHWRGASTEATGGQGAPGSGSGVAEDDPLLSVPTPELDPATRYEFNRDLNDALNLLKPDDRSIVYLYAVEGFSMAEIAQALGLTESAVKVRAHRSYVKMREQLK